MQFSREQQLAIDKVHHWYERSSEQVFHFFGYAGVGKTTLAKYFADGINGNVLYGAYTGKAAYVLQTKGCEDARTIHSLIYHSREKGKANLIRLEAELVQMVAEFVSLGIPEKDFHLRNSYAELVAEIAREKFHATQPMFVLNPESDAKDADLIIIDECSMVDAKMGEDLLSFGVPVLVLGDPAQLPPVGGAGYFTENVKPDVMLTEIHRQAAESPIINMATRVRNGEGLPVGKYGDCEVVASGTKLDPERVLAFDQILVGRNRTRFATNQKVRRLLGIEDKYPIVNDRLVCLRNNHELGILNGAIFEVTDVEGIIDGHVHMTVISEDTQQQVKVHAHEQHFLEGNGDNIKWFDKKDAEEFDFGYALTVHKSQGSQWKSVGVFDESWCFRADRNRWLYTAITRAAENLTVVKM